MSFYRKLIAVLKKDRRFVDEDGELVLAAVQDHAWRMDHGLVKLLLADKEIKAKFFDEIEGTGSSTSIPSSSTCRRRTSWTTPTPGSATESA